MRALAIGFGFFARLEDFKEYHEFHESPDAKTGIFSLAHSPCPSRPRTDQHSTSREEQEEWKEREKKKLAKKGAANRNSSARAVFCFLRF